MLAQTQLSPPTVRRWLDDARWWQLNPVFRNQDARVHGVPVGELSEHLREIYTEDACRAMISAGFWAPLLGLFIGPPFEWAARMLALALDLREVGTRRDAEFGVRLCDEHWVGARVELGMWAGLLRRRLEPRRPNVTRGKPAWDLTVERDQEFLIESKALSPGNSDGNFDHIYQFFTGCSGEFGVAPLCDATLDLSPQMLDHMRRTQTQPFYESTLQEFMHSLTGALRTSSVHGQPLPVGRFGTVTRTPPAEDDGMLRWVVNGYVQPPLQRVTRLVREFRDATSNFALAPRGARRVAVVWTGVDYLPTDPIAALLANHIGDDVISGGNRICLNPAHFGFDTGLLLGEQTHFWSTGCTRESASFGVGDSRDELPTAIREGLVNWQYLAFLDGEG